MYEDGDGKWKMSLELCVQVSSMDLSEAVEQH